MKKQTQDTYPIRPNSPGDSQSQDSSPMDSNPLFSSPFNQTHPKIEDVGTHCCTADVVHNAVHTTKSPLQIRQQDCLVYQPQPDVVH
ncbi:hypothetical protein HYC85_015197 [Camellia sinensis]|uniref:Uncharacterized protein n=1 Tax=Camellia sinensis TaxID=4442 RepID=A0A7J7GW32_CAMSI|nr:hypothetical protein HYC85_015197 [Camellia sinensis]